MQCPYNTLALKVSLLSALKKIGDSDEDLKRFEQMMKRLDAEFAEFHIPNHKDLNEKTAHFHGITLSDLINSPNYEILLSKYKESVFLKIFQTIQDEYKLEDAETWAIFYADKL